IAGNATICQSNTTDATYPVTTPITFTGFDDQTQSTSTGPYTYTYTLNGTPLGGTLSTTTTTVTDNAGNGTAIVNAPTNVAGTFTYTLNSVLDASGTLCTRIIDNQSVTVVVNPLPTASIAGNATICQSNTTDATYPVTTPITFTGFDDQTQSTSTGPYTYTYPLSGTPRGGTLSTTTTTVTDNAGNGT